MEMKLESREREQHIITGAENKNREVLIEMDRMQDASEVVYYDRTGVPLYIRENRLSCYPDMKAECHWHEDIELIHILEGIMAYRINGEQILLEQGDSLLVNARQMHYGFSHCRRECRFICILFHPKLLTENRMLYKELVRPVIDDSGMEYIRFPAADKIGQEIGRMQLEILKKKEEDALYYELEAVSILQRMWVMLLREYRLAELHPEIHKDENLVLQRKMMDFIFQHYQEKISLDDIAKSAHVGRSKCCALFRQYLQDSPIDFLNQYRLKVCRELLLGTDKSVTEIALGCGFNQLSYFSSQFVRFTGCTPREYRAKRIKRQM